MLSQVSEKRIHIFRYILVVGWLLLIFSLFYDPVTSFLTDPNQLWSPLRDTVLTYANDPSTCVRVQGECLTEAPYPVGARLFWGMIVPCGIAIVFILGHETWRRICPLYFLSQIPRGLGLKPKLKIQHNQWLINNHLYLQFGLFFLGLNCRILLVNSARPVFGTFLILTILSAVGIVYLYGGRSWCHYVCPFGMVQMVFTGPRGLFDSKAHTAPPKSITQSMCRTVDRATGKEKIACIGCTSPCMDIDAEKAYWEKLSKPGRRLVQYGYLGLVVGYFVYYWLYAGNPDYYFSGAWTHEENQLATILKPGFYLWGQVIAIPKLIATPLTMGVFGAIFYVLGCKLEKIYSAYLRRKKGSVDRELVLHHIFSVVTFLSFNAFYIYGGRPEIMRLPTILQLIFNGLVVLVSTFWLYRTWGHSSEQYRKESIADKLRRQLKKLNLNFSQILHNRSLEDLKPDELDILYQVIPQVTHQDRLTVYKGVLEESLTAGNVKANNSLTNLQGIRQQLEISEEEHYALLTELNIEDPTLIGSNGQYTQEDHLRMESYRKEIATLLQDLLDSGVSLEEAIDRKIKQIRNLRHEYHITKQEHLQILSGTFDALRPKAEGLLALLQIEASRYRALANMSNAYQNPLLQLLQKLLLAKQQLLITPLLTILEMLNDESDAISLAARTGVLAEDAIAEVLADESAAWLERLNPSIIKELKPYRESTQVSENNPFATETTQLSSANIPSQSGKEVLLELLQEPNPITQALSVYSLVQIDQQQGLAKARSIVNNPSMNNLVKETAASLLNPANNSAWIIKQLLVIAQQTNFTSMTSQQLLSVISALQKQKSEETKVNC
ncbi:MAG: 4Fe-4S binding protein [Xenococcaceae cyanobacterium MO_207.B15]|nr:4Fe-4S binding protein [Xenococcaceae cyanobacterium MO_207.B15]MDJ0747306.1 4Fe-4S binding protein [Xenococcaceae cyanobacterium MO_167.B27]